MAENRGKQFENVIKEAFNSVDGVSIDRLPDQTNGFAGGSNICDFIAYKKPYEYYLECKAIHGNTLSIHSNDPKRKYGNISNKQFEGLLEKADIDGVSAGIICWWIDHNVTMWLDIRMIKFLRLSGKKSIRFDANETGFIPITGRKKKIFFDYNISDFLKVMESGYKHLNALTMPKIERGE